MGESVGALLITKWKKSQVGFELGSGTGAQTTFPLALTEFLCFSI